MSDCLSPVRGHSGRFSKLQILREILKSAKSEDRSPQLHLFISISCFHLAKGQAEDQGPMGLLL